MAEQNARLKKIGTEHFTIINTGHKYKEWQIYSSDVKAEEANVQILDITTCNEHGTFKKCMAIESNQIDELIELLQIAKKKFLR